MTGEGQWKNPGVLSAEDEEAKPGVTPVQIGRGRRKLGEWQDGLSHVAFRMTAQVTQQP